MKSLVRYIAIGLLVLTLSACNEESTVSGNDELKESDMAAINLTTQVDGVFKGFAGANQKSVIIEFEGVEKTYEIIENAPGDFDKIKKDDNIAFSTKMVDGVEMIETLRLN
ncbi:hypothetical protein [Paenisporosarcina sp. TG20]|uniref:hypothetical protein n=1 Tax=Paenisporosarcina sp. TG20 TaxID=1211706 RepID=UPI0002F0B423|nr:hypothetical protein [Paenisporosarcina sp. TG20]